MRPELAALLHTLDRLPIFPLPSAVLLPFEMLPLHVFEPRYRELTHDVLAGGLPFGVVQLAPGWEGDYEGRPPVEPLCGIGTVLRHEKLADGRYNLVVRGIARVRIVGEHPPRRLYREVRAELVDDRTSELGEDAARLAAETVRGMVLSLCTSRPGAGSNALASLVAKAGEPAEVADVVVAALLTELGARRRALLTLDAARRLALAEVALAELLAAAPGASDPGSRN